MLLNKGMLVQLDNCSDFFGTKTKKLGTIHAMILAVRRIKLHEFSSAEYTRYHAGPHTFDWGHMYFIICMTQFGIIKIVAHSSAVLVINVCR